MSVFEFHEGLANSSVGVYAVSNFLSSPNKSLPVKSSHSKSLMLATVMNNSVYSKLNKAKLLGVHNEMMEDHYYHALFSNLISNVP